ncbi:hypothetical protein PHLCEN_2v8996 [Hermanssonia centrifuga]|uniref:Caffeoyl-CoA O-methyltransferase n=1 Tax=Hermanssonia centrifuga TaxID=98765 RepID=A0A2R6NS60_9APHY|nr:hypothetical protein PHLCEN_2v8996 [Hermanssonia centrifuga]
MSAVSDHQHPGDTPHDRLALLIDQLCLEIDSQPASTTDRVRTLATQAKELIDGYDSYMSGMSSPHPPVLDTMLEEGNKRDWKRIHKEGKTQFCLVPAMCAGTYEAVVLQHLAKLSKARTILEIGMFIGTTTVSLAMLPGVEQVVSLELEGYLEEINRPYFKLAGVSDKIDVRIGDAIASLDKLIEEGASFDMVFIDADKPNYINYFKKVVESKLLAKGGFIAADNVAYKGSPWAPDQSYRMGPHIDDFNRAVREYPGVEVVMLSIEDGISLIRRKGE